MTSKKLSLFMWLGALVIVVPSFTPLWARTEMSAVSPWDLLLRESYFGDRPILESDEVIALEAPRRAENAAIVPIKIRAQIPQTEERYIKTLTLLIDKNPVPLAGTFHFTPKSGRADLALRVRINAYSHIRAIAETNDGELHMTKEFVKASGGCSAPVGTDLEAAMKRLGKMKFKTARISSTGDPVSTQLGISHPNITGLQMDQVTQLYMPAHFVNKVKVSLDGELVFSAETDISVSENPNFRFYLVPQAESEGKGELIAEVEDTHGSKFTKTYQLAPARIAVQP